jgi:hypothetical protein
LYSLELASQEEVLDLVQTILICAWSDLSCKEIEALIPSITDYKQTYVYKLARQEGLRLGWYEKIVSKMLSKRFGELSDRHTSQISELEITQLEQLAEALLDFVNISDLDRWLANLS